MSSDAVFEHRINLLDPLLFSTIESQSSINDRITWLALQRATRRAQNGYAYLEIGSHLGGSIHPHMLDPKCRMIFSIDKRPFEQPDERGFTLLYEGNSTERMLQNLQSVDPNQMGKISCFDSAARDVDAALIEPSPDMCFIDAEHTNAAVVSDFEFCLEVCAPNAVIFFHDDRIIYQALVEIGRILRKRKIPFVPLKLPGSNYAIALRDCPVCRDDTVLGLSIDGNRWLCEERFKAFAKRHVPRRLWPAVRPIGAHLLGNRREESK